MTPKPRFHHENNAQNYKNFTNTCSYEVLSSLFNREYLELHGDIDILYLFKIERKLWPQNHVYTLKKTCKLCHPRSFWVLSIIKQTIYFSDSV